MMLPKDEAFQDNDDNILATLNSHLDAAAGVLQGEAKKLLLFPTSQNRAEANIWKGPYELSSMWPTPPTPQAEAPPPKCPPSISMDVNRFLALNKLPHHLGKKEGSPGFDVGEKLATEMFGHPQKIPTVPDGLIMHTTQSIDDPVTGVKMMGVHTFYHVPLGKGSHVAWHSHLRLFAYVPDTASELLKKENETLAVTGTQDNDSPSESHNSVTISVQWMGARGVRKVTTDAVK